MNGVLRHNARLAAITGIAALAALTSASASAIAPDPPPPSACEVERRSLEAVGERITLLSPSEALKVSAGATLTFSADSEEAPTFEVASAPKLLASGDVDHGIGVRQPGTDTYTFTSTRAAAEPGILYWGVKLERETAACAALITYTTPPRKLIVAGSASTQGRIAPLVRRVLLREARFSASSVWGSREVHDVQAVLTTAQRADRTLRAAGVKPRTLEGASSEIPAEAFVYLVAMRGHFCSPPVFLALSRGQHRECTSVGTMRISSPFNAHEPHLALLLPLARRYPALAQLGNAVKLDARRREALRVPGERAGAAHARVASAHASAGSHFSIPSSARQLVVVSSPTYDPPGYVASLSSFQRASAASPWRPLFGTWPAEIGSGELRNVRREGDHATPTGVYPFGLTIYGNEPNPGGLHEPYHHLVCGDWWDEDPYSAQYSSFVHVPCDFTPPFAAWSEALWTETRAYPYFAVIDYNDDPVISGPNAPGSGIFLHVWMGEPTEGCVALHLPELLRILRWLDPAEHPVIEIGTDAELGRIPPPAA